MVLRELPMLREGVAPSPAQPLGGGRGLSSDGRRGAAVLRPRDAYRDVPILQKPTWGSEIAAYFYLGGISGGATVVGSLAVLVGGKRRMKLARPAHYVAFATLIPCPVLLIADLGQRKRFHHMLRIFKPSSPMNFGAWTLTIHGGMATLILMRMLAAENKLPLIGPLIKLLPEKPLAAGAIPSALALGGYTGVLLGTTSVPVWFKSPLLGALFMASSFSTGVAATSLTADMTKRMEHGDSHTLSIMTSLTGIGELLLLGGYLGTSGRAARSLVSGKTGLLMGAAAAALSSATVLETRSLSQPSSSRSRHSALALLTLVGGALLRWAVVLAGRTSASDRDGTLEAMSPSSRAPGWEPSSGTHQYGSSNGVHVASKW